MARVLHIITGLNIGGAEMMLYKLLDHTPGASDSRMVLSLIGGGPIADRITAIGVPVRSLGLKRGRMNLRAIVKCVRVIRQFNPDVVHTWLYHANAIGGVAAMLGGVKNIVWGIRSSLSGWSDTKWQTRLVIKAGALMARRIPTRIVSVSSKAVEQHVQIGYPRDLFRVIPNGFDLASFKPDSGSRKRLGAALNVGAEVRLVGSVGRFHEHKDYRNLIQAFGRIAEKNSHLVLVGHGLNPDNKKLLKWIEEAEVGVRTSLLGPREDIAEILSGLDLFVLSSSTEGFPNVVGESMACGTPCVGTDVGDTSYVIGDTGLSVPAQDPKALALAINEMLALSELELSQKKKEARKRIEMNFMMDRVVRLYEDLYHEVTE